MTVWKDDVRPEGYTQEQALAAVGAGWRWLVDQAWRQRPRETTITQVKEKFGKLRIYHQPYNAMYQRQLDDIEVASGAVCELCGKLGSTTGRHYRRTLCDEHARTHESD